MIQWPSRECLQGQLSKTIIDRDNYSLVLKEGENHMSSLRFMCVYEPNFLIHSVSM